MEDGTRRWIKRMLLYILLMFLPYSFFIDIYPESGVRWSGSILWTFSSFEPYPGLYVIPSISLVFFFILTSLPSFVFLYYKDQTPSHIPLSSIVITALLLTFFLHIAAFILIPTFGIPSSVIYAGPFVTFPVLIAFVLIPYVRWELNRKGNEDIDIWFEESRFQELTQSNSRKTGLIMFYLSLFSPLGFMVSWSTVTFQASTWWLYLSVRLDYEIWFLIYPVEFVLLFVFPYILSFVFAYKVWMTSRGLAKERTTILIGLLSLVVVPASSTFFTPFMLTLPFPLLFCVGLLFLSRNR